ncbi:hypothetical protein LTR08_001742 [Meristemomyces frigidus]|nr:hypothetical protein LTR08_001742 [Meristemomyces frigidus]
MFVNVFGNRHDRNSDGASASNTAQPLVSPLQANFDFGLPTAPSPSPYRISGESLRRPGTSDGLGSRKSGLSLTSAAPVLPPIPRVASRYVSEGRGGAHDKRRANDESDNLGAFSSNGRQSNPLPAPASFGHTVDFMPTPTPMSSTIGEAGLGIVHDARPSTSGRSTPKMESSLFPLKPGTSFLPPINSGPPMSRAFIDSRDKTYSHTASRPSQQLSLQQSQSVPYMSPNMLSLQSPTSQNSYSSQSPISPPLPTSLSANSLRAPKISGARLSPNSSVEDLRLPLRSPTMAARSNTAATNYSGSTAVTSPHPSVLKPQSYSPRSPLPPLPTQSPLAQTIGTPYQSTSSSFPLPQHVATRPKTAGAAATVAGISVPTHHTTSLRPDPTAPHPKPERRKTRLLNPMALLTRRKSGQDVETTPAERSVAAQAYARQKSVAAVGVKNLPADFDPRIKGSVVHDFSAPRQPRRNFSYSDADVLMPAEDRYSNPHSYSAKSSPQVPQSDFGSSFETQTLLPPPSSSTGGGGGAQHGEDASESANRRSAAHSPGMFRELLDEDSLSAADAAKRESLVNAERLENVGFLQRASLQSSGRESAFSQESAVLPPFARRSQFLVEGGGGRDEGGGSTQHHQRDISGVSSSGASSSVSPVTARGSGAPLLHGGVGVGVGDHILRDSLGQSLSPVSPRSPERGGRLSGWSEMSGIALRPQALEVREGGRAGAGPGGGARSSGSAREEGFAVLLRPGGEGVVVGEERAFGVGGGGGGGERGAMVNRASAFAPQAVLIPDRSSSLAPPSRLPRDHLSNPLPADVGGSVGTSPELTPELRQAESVVVASATRAPAGVRMVEKRASAAGHSSSRQRAPARHRVSNASRFSFQFGDGGGMEEEVLGGGWGDGEVRLDGRGGVGREEDEEEEEVFDEGAMDDLDEFEVQEQRMSRGRNHGLDGGGAAGGGLRVPGADDGDDDDDDASVYDDDDDATPSTTNEPELTYADHPAFRAHSALASTRSNASVQTNGWRASQYGHGHGHEPQQSPQEARHFLQGAAAPAQPGESVPEGFTPGEEGVRGGGGGAGFYMQPLAAGYYSPAAGSPRTERPPAAGSPRTERPPALPHRDSGNSERNRVASGVSFASAGQPRVTSQVSGVSPLKMMAASGLGVSGFGDFNFSDGPDLSMSGSRPASRDVGESAAAMHHRRVLDSEMVPRRTEGWLEANGQTSMGPQPAGEMRRSGLGYFPSPESGGHSAAYQGTIGGGIRAKNAEAEQHSRYVDDDSDSDGRGGDDMYFDDGGFEQDVRHPRHRHDSVDETDFDDEGFLQRTGALGGHYQRDTSALESHHQRDTSGLSVASLGGNGPYPSFAMGANPAQARQRQSVMLLEDLPLHQPPPSASAEPKLLPLQRNPSEDAKRLGLSGRVPPLPVPEGSREGVARMQASLLAYHAALAEAANQAANEGRFLRQLSVAETASSLSVRSRGVESEAAGDDRSYYSRDDRSQYSKDEREDGRGRVVPEGSQGLNRSVSEVTSGSRDERGYSYTPPKLDFDFGFGAAGLMDDGPGDDDDDDLDAEMVAAANGEVLASDDEGFYGQEFGFYAHARPNSGEVQAINGGFFGQDGDDGVARNKSLKEPNLTPITERSEFSARNSLINLGHGGAFGAPSAGGLGAVAVSPALARMPVSPLVDHVDVASFEQLRRLKASAFRGSGGSVGSAGVEYGGAKGAGHGAWQSPPQAQGYFAAVGGAAAGFGAQGTDGSGSSNGSGRRPEQLDGSPRQHFRDRAESSAMGVQPNASQGGQFSEQATPRKGGVQAGLNLEPVTARKVAGPGNGNGAQAHARKGSDSVTYVKELDPVGGGQMRWVLERRRTGELGQLELVGREPVQGGWI